MKYLILMQVDPAVLERLTEEQSRMIGEGHAAFIARTKESGEFVATQALADPSQTKVVRARNGVPEVTDGPFAEAKEFLGGFYLLDIEDEARALELAKQIPDASIDGLALEIRPVMFSDAWPASCTLCHAIRRSLGCSPSCSLRRRGFRRASRTVD